MADESFVDGVSSVPAAPVQQDVGDVKKMSLSSPTVLKAGLLVGLAIPYSIYALWCFFLLSSFPSQGSSSTIITIGVVSTIVGALVLIGVGTFGFMRVSTSKALSNTKMMALIKLGAFIFPGLILSVVTPFVISAEPTFSITIVSPTSADQFVAPLSVNFSVQTAINALAERGFKPIQFNWDINGDKKPDQQTLSPELTASFDKEGIYGVSVVMKSSDGTTKTASKRFIISKSVFLVTPSPAIVDLPVVFSLAGLYPKPDDVLTSAWDFDGDGKIDDENGGTQTSFTYLSTGSYSVTVTVALANKTQIQYQRVIDVTEPPELPFPVSVTTQPSNLIGTPPFPVYFSIETAEPIYSVQWDFGDNDTAEGNTAAHTFAKKGSYAVVAKVRSASGVIATLSTVVKVVDKLDLKDLSFEGSPVVNGNTISGELPLTLDLTPITQVPFVSFSWEAPGATEVGSTETRLQALYRRAGKYTITLIGQDLENRALRLPIEVEVLPPSANVSFDTAVEDGIAPDTVTFNATKSFFPAGDTPIGYVWNFGDGSPEQTKGSIYNHSYERSGTFTVSVRFIMKSGKEYTASNKLVLRSPELKAGIFASRLSAPAGSGITFDSKLSRGDIISCVWDFDDGTQNDGCSDVSHVFLNIGTYSVSLKVTDRTKKTDTSTISITIQ